MRKRSGKWGVGGDYGEVRLVKVEAAVIGNVRGNTVECLG